MVNWDDYRWKNMVGPRDERPAVTGFWYRYSSSGWGIVEFIRFCRAAGFLCIPDFCINETPQDMADFVEYVNGDADSTWGKKRVADGHPEPFRLKYIQLGNEEAVNEVYWSKFKPMAEAIWAKDPNITIVVGDFYFAEEITDPNNIKRASGGIKSLDAQKKIVELAYSKGAKVGFDLHVSNDDPDQPDRPDCGVLGLRSFVRELRKLCPNMPFKAYVFEENAGNHTLRRGLGHAHMVGELMRIGDDVPIVCAANCLQPDKQNDNGWDQGLLFLSASKVWPQPSYFVTQMISSHYLPNCVEASFDGPQHVLDITATKSDDGEILQLAVVNTQQSAVTSAIEIKGWNLPETVMAKIEWIAGNLSDANTEESPRNIVSHKASRKLHVQNGRFPYMFPANSFTIIRLQN